MLAVLPVVVLGFMAISAMLLTKSIVQAPDTITKACFGIGLCILLVLWLVLYDDIVYGSLVCLCAATATRATLRRA